MSTHDRGSVATIFISYRRKDASDSAGRLHAELRRRLPGIRLFMDVDNIRAGDNFVDALDNTLKTTDLMLVVIGEKWLNVVDDHGRRRLDDPQDYVRREIATALERDIRVVPLLVQDATPPQEADLPEPLKALAKRQALELRHKRYGDDVSQLVKELQGTLVISVDPRVPSKGGALRRIPSARWLGAGVAAVALAVALGLWASSRGSGESGGTSPAVVPTRFTSVDLAPYANDSIDWVVNEPTGDQTFDGVPFKILAGSRAAVKSSTVGRPTWPTRFSFPIGAQPGVQRVHAMLTGSWVDQEPSGSIGTLSVVYRGGNNTGVDLVKGHTIQEGWRTERDLFGGAAPPPVPGVRWRTVHHEEQMRGAKSFATLDVLSVDVDQARAVERIELARSSERAGFALVALTLER